MRSKHSEVYLVLSDRGVVIARLLPGNGDRRVQRLLNEDAADFIGYVLKSLLGRFFELLLKCGNLSGFCHLYFFSFHIFQYLCLRQFNFLRFHINVTFIVFIAFECYMR